MSATELVRVKPQGAMRRLKRHVSWLRTMAAEVKHRTIQPLVPLIHAPERSRAR